MIVISPSFSQDPSLEEETSALVRCAYTVGYTYLTFQCEDERERGAKCRREMSIHILLMIICPLAMEFISAVKQQSFWHR